MESTISLVLGLIGIIGGLFGALSWYSGAVQKRYAAERDFQHLKRTLEQLALNIDNRQSEIINLIQNKHEFLKKELDEIESEEKEIKSLIQIIIIKVSGEGTSGIFRRKG